MGQLTTKDNQLVTELAEQVKEKLKSPGSATQAAQAICQALQGVCPKIQAVVQHDFGINTTSGVTVQNTANTNKVTVTIGSSSDAQEGKATVKVTKKEPAQTPAQTATVDFVVTAGTTSDQNQQIASLLALAMVNPKVIAAA